MVFAIIFAGLHLMALAVSVTDPVVGQSVFGLCQAFLGLAVLTYGPTRRAAFAVLGQYWIAVTAFAAVVAMTAWHAGLLGNAHGAINPFAAQTEVWTLAALLLAFMAAAAGAGASGRRPLFEALLVVSLGFAVIDIGRKLTSGPDLSPAAAQQTAEIYALATLFAAFAVYDATRFPPRDRAHRRVSVRVGLPAVALGASALGLVLCSAPLTMAATLAALGATALAMALREWPQRLTIVNALTGFALIGLSVAMFAAYGAPGDPFAAAAVKNSLLTGTKGAYGLGSGAEGGPALTWLVEAGIWGAGALAAAGVLFAGRLAFSRDRRKGPSRGLALALGAFTAGLLMGPAGLSAAGAATLAIMIGLSASYADPLRQSQNAAKAKRSAAQKTAIDEASEPLVDQPA